MSHLGLVTVPGVTHGLIYFLGDTKLRGSVSSLDETRTYFRLTTREASSGNATEKEQRLSPWMLPGGRKAAWELGKKRVFFQSQDTSEVSGVKREVKKAEETNCTFMTIVLS